jgi:hypothetical protein
LSFGGGSHRIRSRSVARLLAYFQEANVVICAEHADFWGEDGIWEHGVSHAKVLEVPLLFRLVTSAHGGHR